MQYRRLGRCGLKISEIGLGGWLTFGENVEDSEAIRIIRRAFELGINFFDCADVYANGESERVMGKALSEFPREEIVIATKVRGRMWKGPLGEGLSRKHIMEAVEHSLRRLNVDYIDLYQVHWPDEETPIDETMETLDDLIGQGKVLYVGCSNFTTEQLRDALEVADRHGITRFHSIQPHYNMIRRDIEATLLPRCAAQGIGVVCYCPLAQGLLTGRYKKGYRPKRGERASYHAHFREAYLTPKNLAVVAKLSALAKKRKKTLAQYALAWILRRPEVTSAIVGASRVQQVEENVQASGWSLPKTDLESIDEIMKDVIVWHR